jgi:hypothetical protein
MDKVSIVAISRAIQAETRTHTIGALAAQLGVPLMTESRHRQQFMKKILAQPTEHAASSVPTYVMDLIKILCHRSGAISMNNERRSYADWFKAALADSHDKGVSWVELASLTGISLDTLERFSNHRYPIDDKRPISPAHQQLASIWASSAPHHRKSLENFWLHLQRRHRDSAVTYKEMRQILIDLGLYGLRGPKIQNHGAQVKKTFDPHAIWEGDAKQIKVTVNGMCFVYYWYAFVDQTTTLLVGSTIGQQESAKEFLTALKDGGDKCATYPIGILIDNRLEGSDIGPIRDFCRDYQIELLRIFPGSSKTNGNIENNFSIFESQVGEIQVRGTTPYDIGQAVAKALVEVFTQQRNHRPRRRLGDRTPSEAASNAKRPEAARTAIEKMARRFDRENRQIDEKWCLIRPAREHFGQLEPGSIDKIKAELGKYPLNDILAAQASYIAQIVRCPDHRYGPEYFLAILRHKRETKAKEIYNETYRAGVELAGQILSRHLSDPQSYADGVLDLLIEIQDEPTPAHQMLRLDAMCWWLVGFGSPDHAAAIWRRVGDYATATQAMTLRWWSQVNEYVTDRIGLFLQLQNDSLKTPSGLYGGVRKVSSILQ